MILKISILWIVFFVLHSLLAADAVKKFFENHLGKLFIIYRLKYNLISIAIFSTIIYLLKDINNHHTLFTAPWLITFGGWFLVLCGSFVLLMALYSYNMLDFTGISQLFGKQEKHDKLITTGLNGIVRHPIYFAIILLSCGVFILLSTDLILVSALLCIVYLFIGTRLEEKKLIKVYGAQYKEYQKKVKMFIPFVF